MGTARHSTKYTAAGAAILLALLSLTACGGGQSTSNGDKIAGRDSVSSVVDINAVIAAAKKEKTVTIYALGDDEAQLVKKGFEAEYPWATVRTVVGSGSDLLSRAVIESRGNTYGADVLEMPPSRLAALTQAKVTQPVHVPNESRVSPELLDATHNGHPVTFNHAFMVYNTNLLTADQVPKDIYDLADPKWKGKIAFDQPQNGTTAAHFLSAMRTEWGDAKWIKWLDGLKANDIHVTADASSAYTAALTGEVPLAISGAGDVFSQDANAPVAAAFPTKVIGFPGYWWLMRTSKHPNMGTLLINWLMSADGQAAYAASGRTPADPTVDSPYSLNNLLPAGSSLVPMTDLLPFWKDPTSYYKEYDLRWPAQ